MAYVILRGDSANASASFGTKAEALAAIRRVIQEGGDAVVRGCALAHSGANGGLTVIAEDADLARLARGDVCAPGRMHPQRPASAA